MAGCQCEHNVKFNGSSAQFKRILWIIIAINFAMFIIEMTASFMANSQALQADSLDFLGDSLTYSMTLVAIGHSLKWRAMSAMFKASLLMLLAFWVLASTIYRVTVTGIPNEFIMGYVAFGAFIANLGCTLLLMKYRDGDANVRSVWLCSRNDAINNLAVIFAATAVFFTQSHWPDLTVAFLMSGLFLHSAFLIFRQARQELKIDYA